MEGRTQGDHTLLSFHLDPRQKLIIHSDALKLAYLVILVVIESHSAQIL